MTRCRRCPFARGLGLQLQNPTDSRNQLTETNCLCVTIWRFEPPDSRKTGKSAGLPSNNLLISRFSGSSPQGLTSNLKIGEFFVLVEELNRVLVEELNRGKD